MDALQVQVGIKVLEPQEVPVRGEVRQDPGEKEAVRFSALAQMGRAVLGQRQAESHHLGSRQAAEVPPSLGNLRQGIAADTVHLDGGDA